VNGILRYLSAPWPNPYLEEGCRYHDHSDGKACEKVESNRNSVMEWSQTAVAEKREDSFDQH